MTTTPTRSRRLALFSLVSALCTVPLGCMSVNAEIPEVTVTRQNLTFEGVPADMPTEVTASVPDDIRERYDLPEPGEPYHFPTMTFSYDRVPLKLPSQTTCELVVEDITVRAHEGSVDLSFVRGLKLTVSDPAKPSVAELTLFEYPEPGTVAPPIARSITLPCKATSYSLDPWKNSSALFKLDVWADLAQLPRQAWAVDIDLFLSGSIAFEL